MEFLKGIIIKQETEYFIFECNNIGYKIYGYCKEPLPTKIFIYINNDFKTNQPIMYGFSSSEERDYFIKLISIKGISGLSIIKIMSQWSVGEIETIRESGNYLLFSSSNIRHSILSKLIHKKVSTSEIDIIVITRTLIKYGFKKKDISDALEKKFKKNVKLEKMIPIIIREINENF